MCIYIKIFFTFFFIISISGEINENEIDFDKNEREARKLNKIYYPIMESVVQTASSMYLVNNSGDLFDFMRDSFPLPDGLRSPYQEYDFVVVGAGSAGSVIAKRLTDDHRTTVLLLETGKPESLATDIPVAAPYLQSTDYVWQYYMEPQPGVCRGMKNERCFWPRGNAVGGSSVVNYMIYTRGRPEEWDRIAADGNYGWSYQDVLEYYKKSEKATLKGFEKEWYRNRDGLLPVEFVPTRTKLLKAFLQAGEILGHPTVDYNAPGPLGFGAIQATISHGRRQSTAKVFLHKHKKRSNLHILPQTQATKVLIDPQTNTAYGVEYYRFGQKFTVRARKEVILSAGPIASPQLLMLSGIGPKKHLAKKGIPLIKDLPVGQTLYDHICFPGLIFTVNSPNRTRLSFSEAAVNLKEIVDWIRNGDGVLSSIGGVEGIGYIKVPHSDQPPNIPDIELISLGGSILSDGGLTGSKAIRRGMRVKENEFNQAFGAIDTVDTWSAFPMLLHPKSVGKLKLKDKNPFSHPKMYGNYLTDPQDMRTFLSSLRHIQALAATPPFQALRARVYPAEYPTCRGLVFDSDEYWECAIRTLTATLHHQIATCRMGPVGDPRAVVDPELRVHGVNGLRVADSSIIPRTTSAHTNAPAIMIGEKVSDLIKNTWGL